jgi:Pullulanase X25 domain/Dockerin type I domain
MQKIILFLMSLCLVSGLVASRFNGDIQSWKVEDFMGFDLVGDSDGTTGDISSAYVYQNNENLHLRLSFADMVSRVDNQIVTDNFAKADLMLTLLVMNKDKIMVRESFSLKYKTGTVNNLSWLRTKKSNLLELKLPAMNIDKKDLLISFSIQENNLLVDEYTASGRDTRDTGNCAFIHHGNQGLTYTEVFYGSDSHPQGTDGSGFDEVLEVHEATDVPGNFHMSGTLMPAAQWHDPQFNDWLIDMVSDGTASMMTSALGQHIMPFVQNNMNDWSVAVESDMVDYRYNYQPHVAWVPERVWLALGQYPDSGVVDSWLGNNWAQHGVWGVVLDDGPHLNGYNNHKIHWMDNGVGIDLRVIPIDNNFVGYMHYDASGAMNHIASMGQYDICVYGTDWEVAAEMNEHAWNGTDDTYFLDNYQSVLWYCHDNYPGVNVWKLDDAIQNADFNGVSANITPGTYGLLGGGDGYGGSNNSWYNEWASAASHSDFHSPAWTYGFIWNNTYENLMNCPDNNLSQLGWYTLMINLHETGWHDSGDISGWEHRYSSHIKNANVYAEASRWAAGQYELDTNAYQSDIDRDGVDEVIMHNDRSFFVFESIGGRAAWVFAKDEFGNAWSVVGSDVAYYSDTDGDYNEGSNNHVAAFSDVYPNYQDNIYEITVLTGSDDEVSVQFAHNELTKTATLITGNAYLDMEYDVTGDIYIKHGFTADLMDIIWNGKGNIQRMWGDYESYCGRRNSASGATVAAVLGSAGGEHNLDFEGTLVQGDEIHSAGSFHFYLYAGYTSEPYDVNFNKVTELDELAAQLGDDIAPEVELAAAYQLNEHLVQIVTTEPVTPATATNPDNYSFNGEIAAYDVTAIYLTHGNRKIVLEYSDTLPDEIAGSILLSNIEDFNGNPISADENVAELSDYIVPHIVGSMNSWAPSNHDFDLVCQDNMLWSVDILLDAGTHEYKVTESNAWDGGDWPSANQVIELEEADEVTIWVNCGLFPGINGSDGYVCHNTNAPIVCGDFMSELGGIDWDQTSDLTAMNDNGEAGDIIAGDGIFSRSLELETGNWEFKIVLNNSWEQGTTSENLFINLDEPATIIFTYNFVDNQVSWQDGNQSLGYGDIDNNGYVESYDAAMILQYFVGIDPPGAPLPWQEWQLLRADVDGNGDTEAFDASLIQRFVVGMIDHFPVEE